MSLVGELCAIDRQALSSYSSPFSSDCWNGARHPILPRLVQNLLGGADRRGVVHLRTARLDLLGDAILLCAACSCALGPLRPTAGHSGPWSAWGSTTSCSAWRPPSGGWCWAAWWPDLRRHVHARSAPTSPTSAAEKRAANFGRLVCVRTRLQSPGTLGGLLGETNLRLRSWSARD